MARQAKRAKIPEPGAIGQHYLAGLRQQVISDEALWGLYQDCPPAPSKALVAPAEFTQPALDVIRGVIPMLKQKLWELQYQDGYLEVPIYQVALTADDRRVVAAFFRRNRYKVTWLSDRSIVSLRGKEFSWRLTISWIL